MKFIGQYIQDFIARFRSDVYLEDVSTGTIASGANLGLDSNNKIVKNTVGGGGTTDLTSDVTGTLPVGNGGTGLTSISTLLNSNVTTISGNSGTATRLATERDLQVDLSESNASGFDGSENVSDIGVGSSVLGVANGGTGLTSISTLLNSNVTSVSGNAGTADALTSGNKTIAGTVTVEVSTIPLITLKRTSTGSDNDNVGTIRFTGNDDADNAIRYGAISAKIIDASDGAEEGQLNLAVASHDGEEVTGLSITSGDAEDEVDATIGNGATSLTTVAGTLTMGSTATLDNSGNLLTNAATATALATARNIAGVSFDGTGDISLNNNAITNGAGYTTNTGDIDRVRISTSSGNAEVTSGNADFTLSGTAPIGVTNSGATITIAANDASSSAKGVVELATTAEADTGTDTARAVTPAGLKSHVDARYTNQIFSFTFSDLNYVSDTWTTPSQHGPTFYSWNNRHGIASSGQAQECSHKPSAVQAGSTIDVDYLDQGAGIVIPVASKFVGFYGNVRTNNTTPNTARPVFAVYRASEPANDNNADITATVIAFDSYDTATGNRKNRFMKLENFPGTPVDLAQGDILFPAIGLDETMSNNTGDILGSFTIVLRTLIP
jgi:hypothetical protein